MTIWASQLRKGHVLVVDGKEYPVAKVESAMGGSWFNVTIVGHEDEPVMFGHRERVAVK